MIPSLPFSCALLAQISPFYLRDCGASPHHDGVLPCAASLGVCLPLPCQTASSPFLSNVSLFSLVCCFCPGVSCPDLDLSPSCASFHLPLYTASSWEDSPYCLHTAALKPTVKSMWAKGSHALYIYFSMKEAGKNTHNNKKKSRSQHCSVSLQSLVCCPGRKAILIHTKKHCKAAASKPRCPPGQKLKMSKFLRMMVWAPCVKAWSLGSHCWEVLWTCRRYSPRKGWGDCGPHLFLFLPPLRCYLTWDVGSFAPPCISTTFHCPTTGSKKSPGLKVPILWIKVNLSFYILISLDILL